MSTDRAPPLGVVRSLAAPLFLPGCLGLAVIIGLVGCASAAPRDASEPSKARGHLITRAEIERSGARDAWEAIRRNANHLRFIEDGDGDLVWVGAYRGNASLMARDAILLVVDGARMVNSRYLNEIPAATVAWIQILSGREGTTRYGVAGGNGVVVVRTRAPGRR